MATDEKNVRAPVPPQYGGNIVENIQKHFEWVAAVKEEENHEIDQMLKNVVREAIGRKSPSGSRPSPG